jgi:transcription elongation factor GreB
LSKAFTNEDDTGDEPVLVKPVSLLPPGSKNLVTPSGAAQLRNELQRLIQVERPPLAGRTDQRIFYVQASLASAEVVNPPPPPHDTVLLGATVNVRESDGATSTYRIVGVDEADFDRGWISWVSPIARALLNARKGQRVAFKTPRGINELEIVGVRYE